MTLLLTAGMWTHTYLTAATLAPTLHTANPIWGELRLCAVMVATLVPWCALDATLR